MKSKRAGRAYFQRNMRRHYAKLEAEGATTMADQELGKAGEDYGRALCLDPSREYLPLDQLSPDESACVLRVGRGFEAKVDQAFGASLPVEGQQGFGVQTSSGSRVASLTMDPDGTVRLCVPGHACAPVGQGVPAAVAAEQTLGLMGYTVADTLTPL